MKWWEALAEWFSGSIVGPGLFICSSQMMAGDGWMRSARLKRSISCFKSRLQNNPEG